MERRAAEFEARRKAIQSVIERLDREAAERDIPDDIYTRLRAHHLDHLSQIELRSYDDDAHKQRVNLLDDIERQVITEEREFINELYIRGELKDEARRRIERGLDLREAEIDSLRDDESS
jgi:CPA1 family monovalent cation:H+ antiporter